MADCCAELASEIAALRAEIAKLHNVDEEKIIEAAYQRSKAKLLPLIEQVSSIAKAAKSGVDALASLAKLIPYIPALIALVGIGALIIGFAARIANAEFRINVLDGGLANANSTIGSVINSVARLQAQLNSLKLQKGDKGDRGSDGKAGYTPVKGRDYFDGKDGQSIKGDRGEPGQSIKGDRGSDGKAGYTPVKGRDYFDGKDGQSIKGDRGLTGAIGAKGENGVGATGATGATGSRGATGATGATGFKGDKEMPTDLTPVLRAIANLNFKVSKCNSDADRNRLKLEAIYQAVNVQIEGVVNVTPCGKPLETFSYSGSGLVGLQTQLITSANQLAKVHEDVCKITTGIGSGVGTTPKASDLLEKIYAILGGSVFYPKGDEEEPKFLTNAEVDIKAEARTLFHEDGSEGSPAVCHNLLDAINISNAVIYYRMGLHEFPASLPTSLISKDKGFFGNLLPTENVDIHNLTRFFTWYVERFDEIMGQWEIPIEIKDSDPSKPGDQPLGIKLPNMAEAIAEMFTLAFQTNLNSETLLNFAVRSAAEAATDKQQNFITYKLMQSMAEWAGYKQKDIKLKMPLLFSLGKTRYDEILNESEIDVACVDFDEKFGLEADLMRFREAVAMLQAVHKRKVNPSGDVKGQILKHLLDTFAAVNKVSGEKDDDDFEKFLTEVEDGFIKTPGANNTTEPYGRPYTERPKIRDLTKHTPPTNP